MSETSLRNFLEKETVESLTNSNNVDLIHLKKNKKRHFATQKSGSSYQSVFFFNFIGRNFLLWRANMGRAESLMQFSFSNTECACTLRSMHDLVKVNKDESLSFVIRKQQ